MNDWAQRLDTPGGRGATLGDITLFWHVLSDRTPTIGKLSFGAGFAAEQRQRESLRD